MHCPSFTSALCHFCEIQKRVMISRVAVATPVPTRWCSNHNKAFERRSNGELERIHVIPHLSWVRQNRTRGVDSATQLLNILF